MSFRPYRWCLFILLFDSTKRNRADKFTDVPISWLPQSYYDVPPSTLVPLSSLGIGVQVSFVKEGGAEREESMACES